MYPILFRIGSYTLHSYTLALVAGMVGGTWLAYRLARERYPDPEIVLDAGFWGLLGGVVGGRCGHVAANWAYYAAHLDRVTHLRGGGLSWHGALIGGLASIGVWFIVRRYLRRPLPGYLDLLDFLAPGLALGSAFGWLGSLLSGAAYGAEAGGYAPPLSWLAAELPDIYGVVEVRFLSQPLMIAWCLALCGLLWGLRHRLQPGLAFALYLLLYALADWAVAHLRGDGTWRWGLWLSQWAAIAEACVAVGWALWAWRRQADPH